MPKKRYDHTSAKRQAKRRAALDRAALSMGFPSWSAFETAIINRLVGVTRQMSYEIKELTLIMTKESDEIPKID